MSRFLWREKCLHAPPNTTLARPSRVKKYENSLGNYAFSAMSGSCWPGRAQAKDSFSSLIFRFAAIARSRLARL